MTSTLCDATCGNVVYVRRNAAFTLHLGHVTGDMKQCEIESDETLTHTCARIMRAHCGYIYARERIAHIT